MARPYLLPAPWEVWRLEARACARAQNNLSEAGPSEKMWKQICQMQRCMDCWGTHKHQLTVQFARHNSTSIKYRIGDVAEGKGHPVLSVVFS